jgi:hypothetical protein
LLCNPHPLFHLLFYHGYKVNKPIDIGIFEDT